MTEIKFTDFWMNLFIRPKVFFKRNLINSKQQPSYFPLAIIVFGIGYGIDRLDRQLTKFDFST